MKIIKKLLIITLVLMSFSSCIPSSTLSQRALIQAISIDYINEEFVVTMQLYTPQNGKENVTDTSTNIEILTAKGDSIIKALRNAEQINGKEVFQSQNKVILLGKSICDYGIEKIATYFSSDYNIRSNVKLFIYNGRAYDLLKLKTERGYYSMSDLEEIANRSKLTGMISETTVLDLKRAFDDKSPSFIIPVVSIDKSNDNQAVLVNQSMIFNKFKEYKIYDFEQTRAILMIRNEVNSLSYSLKDDNNEKVLIDLRDIKAKKSIKKVGDNYNVNIIITGQGSIAEKTQNSEIDINYYTDLGKRISDSLKNDLIGSIDNAQKEMKCDVYDIYKLIRQKDKGFYMSLGDDYNKFFSGMVFTVETDIKIHRVGLETM